MRTRTSSLMDGKDYTKRNFVFSDDHSVDTNKMVKLLNQNKMTAVEWLTDKFYANEGIMKSEWLEQAKEMDKEQKKLIFVFGRNFQLTREGTFEEVYNETFKSE